MSDVTQESRTAIRSDSIAALVAALAKAQGEMEGAAKDSVNPHFKARYASLAAVWEACRGPLTKNGLAILQPVRADGAKVTVTTILAHNSGEWISEDLTVTAQTATPQGVGSAITYGRRYGLASMVGIAPDDDDGQAASEGAEEATPEPAQRRQYPPARPAPPPKRDPSHGPTVTHAKIALEGKTEKGTPYTLYAISFSNGQEGTTFHKSVYEAAERFKVTGQEVEPVIEDRKGKKVLVELRPIFRRDSPVAAEVGTEA